MEASAIQAPGGHRATRISIGAPLLRLRSNEQLVTLFRTGNDEAFTEIHDRYRPNLLAYVRQTLGTSRADAEDVLQDVFVRAYRSLRSQDRDLSLRPWLYRIARNACIDELRRHVPVPHAEIPHAGRVGEHDPVVAESERRETLRRLVRDLGRLPEQQRSALLMRELGGMSYTEVAAALGTSVGAVKSLLVRARLGLVRSLEARDTACVEIRDELAGAYARGERPNPLANRHMRDCACCRQYRREIRRRERHLAALAPWLGPMAPLAKLIGTGFGAGRSVAASGSAGGAASAAASGGATVGGAANAGGFVLSAGTLGATVTHVATLVAAAVIAAAGAVGLREATISPPAPSSGQRPAAVGTAVSTFSAVGAMSASHLQVRPAPRHGTSPSQPRQPSPSTAGTSMGAGTPRSVVVSSGAQPGASGATTSPTGSMPRSSCPIGQASGCTASKSATPTGGSNTTSKDGSTPPLGSGGTDTGAGTSSGTAATGKGANAATGTGLGATGTGTAGGLTSNQTSGSSPPLATSGTRLGS